jgi:hypothetical protein
LGERPDGLVAFGLGGPEVGVGGCSTTVAESLGLKHYEVAALAANRVRSSFLPPVRKAKLLAEIAAVPPIAG